MLNERRRSRRRRLAFLRSGVLEVDGRSHIISVTDIGPEGAFLTTRVPVASGKHLVLKMILPLDSRPVALPCRVVWRSEAGGRGSRSGVAVRFEDVDEAVLRRVEQFAAEAVQASSDAHQGDRFEYRVMDVPDVDADVLNGAGVEGWQLASALPSGRGLRLVLCRRL